ncbi:MAG: lipopolysaccharide biosynthesis protein [Gemmatimonadetes bacterium]|jgi:uncharacterized protein involved in exopolysaccharide biosynthesis|nr:lipopolysaccharide biosynthesis protein [Gemmatimonadota bacterium]
MPPTVQRSRPSDIGPGQNEASIWSYANIVLRRRRLLVVLPVLCALLALAYSVVSSRKYTARASFIPTESASRGSMAGLAGLAATIGVSQLGALGGSPSGSAQFYADLLQARELQLAAIRTRYVAPAGASPFTGTLIRYFKLEKEDSVRAEVKALRKLDDITSISFDRLTSVVHLSVTTKNPQLSAQVARRLLDLTNDFNQRRRQAQYGAEREFVEQQSSEAATALRNAEDALTAFQVQNRTMMSPLLSAEQRRRERAVDLARQIYVNLAQQQAMTRMEAVRSTPLIAVIDAPESLVEPDRPHQVVATLGGGAFGLLLVIIFAFLAESMARARERNADEYEEFLRLRGKTPARPAATL